MLWGGELNHYNLSIKKTSRKKIKKNENRRKALMIHETKKKKNHHHRTNFLWAKILFIGGCTLLWVPFKMTERSMAAGVNPKGITDFLLLFLMDR
jgi:hypothetical protein